MQIQERKTLRQGITITFRGSEPDSEGNPEGEFIEMDLIVPPLNFDALEIMQSRLQSLTLQPTAESMKTLVEALSRALNRNYVSVPRWLITQTIDVANMADIVVALMDVSGLKRKEIEEAKKAMPAAPMNFTQTPSGTTSLVS